jgi:hypothetical protein
MSATNAEISNNTHNRNISQTTQPQAEISTPKAGESIDIWHDSQYASTKK